MNLFHSNNVPHQRSFSTVSAFYLLQTSSSAHELPYKRKPLSRLNPPFLSPISHSSSISSAIANLSLFPSPPCQTLTLPPNSPPMPSHLLSNSPSTAAGSSSDVVLHSSSSSAAAVDISPAGDISAAAASSSSPSAYSRLAEMWNYLWIPFLISLSKEFGPAKAEPQPAILLPSQLHHRGDSPPRCPVPDTKLNYRPVIGIVSHPGDGASGRLSNASSASYIAASYVKFVESAGARVIPIIYNEPPEIIFQKLNLVNGVLFTGGWAKTGVYYEIVERIFKKVLEKNDAGEYFPLYAICLGFELLTMIISKDKKILESFSASDMASTLQFTPNVNIEGTVFQRFPPDLLRKLSTDCLVMQNHKYGISPERFQENRDLSKFFQILTTSADEDNKVYVSTVHANSYPVTAFQWHPEKNAFEWGLTQIPHSEDAIHVTQHAANFLVSEARKSSNRPPLQKVLDSLVYNYSPTYCGKAGRGYDEVYIFTRSSM